MGVACNLASFAHRGRHSACSVEVRHRHLQPYAALVLSGGYLEAGEAGRWLAGPGDVLLHGPFDAHCDAFGDQGAEILNLPLPFDVAPIHCGRVDDPDAIVRCAEKDPAAAAELLLASLTPLEPMLDHWADRLVADIWSDPALRLSEWAESEGMAPATLSRTFCQLYGIPPVRFRNELRARKAVSAILIDGTSLAYAAIDAGFADQPHMTREVCKVTGRSPGRWARSEYSSRNGSGVPCPVPCNH